MTEAKSPAPATGRRSDRMRSLTLAALAILSPLALNLYLPALPDIGAWFGVDIQRIELSVGLFLIGLGAGQLIGAPVSDRYGRRPSTMLGLAFFAAPTIFILSSQSADQFILFRCVQGIGLGIATVNIAAVIADLADTQGAARSLTLIQVAQAVGHIATPIAGAALVVVFDWRSAFVILLLYCCVLAVVLWIHLPETVPRTEGRGRAVLRQATRGYPRVLGPPPGAGIRDLPELCGGWQLRLPDRLGLSLLGMVRFGPHSVRLAAGPEHRGLRDRYRVQHASPPPAPGGPDRPACLRRSVSFGPPAPGARWANGTLPSRRGRTSHAHDRGAGVDRRECRRVLPGLLPRSSRHGVSYRRQPALPRGRRCRERAEHGARRYARRNRHRDRGLRGRGGGGEPGRQTCRDECGPPRVGGESMTRPHMPASRGASTASWMHQALVAGGLTDCPPVRGLAIEDMKASDKGAMSDTCRVRMTCWNGLREARPAVEWRSALMSGSPRHDEGRSAILRHVPQASPGGRSRPPTLPPTAATPTDPT